jgi:hypothetical protein
VVAILSVNYGHDQENTTRIFRVLRGSGGEGAAWSQWLNLDSLHIRKISVIIPEKIRLNQEIEISFYSERPEKQQINDLSGYHKTFTQDNFLVILEWKIYTERLHQISTSTILLPSF